MDLSAIRFMIERSVKDSIENEDVMMGANEVNADIGTSINIPASEQIYVNTLDIEYDEPENVKVINRLSLQSDRDNGQDREFTGKYRRYTGKLIFPAPFRQDDILNVDFYRQMKYFDDISDTIDLEDRYAPLYVSYGVMKYYKLPTVMARLGEAQARQEAQLAQGQYVNMKQQVTSLYSLANDPVVIQERW